MSNNEESNISIEEVINQSDKMARKAVLMALIEIVRPVDKELAADLAAFTKDAAGYAQFTPEGSEYPLRICLSLVDKDYRTNISTPNEASAQEAFALFVVLKQMALAFWTSFIEHRRDIAERLMKNFPRLRLKVDKANPTTLYFIKDSPKRVGLFCYYVSPDGSALVRK